MQISSRISRPLRVRGACRGGLSCCAALHLQHELRCYANEVRLERGCPKTQTPRRRNAVTRVFPGGRCGFFVLERARFWSLLEGTSQPGPPTHLASSSSRPPPAESVRVTLLVTRLFPSERAKMEGGRRGKPRQVFWRVLPAMSRSPSDQRRSGAASSSWPHLALRVVVDSFPETFVTSRPRSLPHDRD